MAGATGLEPAASCVTGRRSNQSRTDVTNASTGWCGYVSHDPTPVFRQPADRQVTNATPASTFSKPTGGDKLSSSV
jgi:hypothetical protein